MNRFLFSHDEYALQARKHIATLRKARAGIAIEIRWCPAHKEVTGNEKADEWAKMHSSWELQEARLAVLLAQAGALPDRAVPQLDEEPSHPAMLVVPVSNADPGPPLQGVPRVEAAAEDAVVGGEEGDGEVEGPVEGAGPLGRCEVQPCGTGLPLRYGCGKAGAG